MACSKESTEGFCNASGTNWACTPENVCRTCSTFGQKCVGLDRYPNATVNETGMVSGQGDGGHKMQTEIYARGPIACMVYADKAMDEYTGGVFQDDGGGCHGMPNHIVSVVGWGIDRSNKSVPAGIPYWTVRNSWGEAWGEMGYIRIGRGQLDSCLELQCNWATPGRCAVFAPPTPSHSSHTRRGWHVDRVCNPGSTGRWAQAAQHPPPPPPLACFTCFTCFLPRPAIANLDDSGQPQRTLAQPPRPPPPRRWTELNYPCAEGGENCVSTGHWLDPSVTRVPLAVAVTQQ
jgi:hypothetical protein